jgi:8-oxo-dGTP pyrophosphatase MutT (NUDIX family)
MGWRPSITVAAIVESDGRFLLVEELIGGHHVLNQPAGRVEPEEHLVDAVVRETLEETGWHFVPEWLLGVYPWRSPHAQRSSLRFAFAGRVRAHEPQRVLDEPVVAVHWLSREQLLHPPWPLRTPLVLRCIDDWYGGRRLPLAAINDPPP